MRRITERTRALPGACCRCHQRSRDKLRKAHPEEKTSSVEEVRNKLKEHKRNKKAKKGSGARAAAGGAAVGGAAAGCAAGGCGPGSCSAPDQLQHAPTQP